MPNKEFLENYPLYREFEIDCEEGYHINRWNELRDIPKPAIHMHCAFCESDQTFNMDNIYTELEQYVNAGTENKIVRAHYLCSACKKGERVFYIKFYKKRFEYTEEKEKKVKACLFMKKVGQYPPWSIEPDKKLEKLLGKHADYYKKGLVCESQTYGIGAYAYFRRITENVIDSLLESISDLIEPSEREKYKKALEETKKTKITEDKIDLVKNLLPLSLTPEGMNPLKTLHSALSVGIHSKTDEECIKQAEIIKNVLIFLVNQILKTKEDKKEFNDSMKKLLGKK